MEKGVTVRGRAIWLWVSWGVLNMRVQADQTLRRKEVR